MHQPHSLALLLLDPIRTPTMPILRTVMFALEEIRSIMGLRHGTHEPSLPLGRQCV